MLKLERSLENRNKRVTFRVGPGGLFHKEIYFHLNEVQTPLFTMVSSEYVIFDHNPQ